MTMVPPVRYALLRDGPDWACVLPPAVHRRDDDTLTLADGQLTATFESGRLDAGIDSNWERVTVEADAANGSCVSFDSFTSGDPGAVPLWRQEPGLNVLLDRTPGPAPAERTTQRYLWIRLRLERDAGNVPGPVLHQVQAQTTGRSYLEDLPAVYRRDDSPTRFLERWLALFRSDVEGFEQAIDDMPDLFDVQLARADRLSWVAQCLGFEPPPGLTPAQLRALLQRVPALYARRGTVGGLEDWAEIYSGLRPKIVEAWRSRKVWQLECQSMLGFDTVLAPSAPDGLIVPGHPLIDPGGLGLLRQTFDGPAFERTRGTPRIDRTLDFDSHPLDLSLPEEPPLVSHVTTLRWTGQVRPRHAERYTFSLRLEGADAGDDVRVRFWIDGMPLVDSWQDAAVDPAGQVDNIRSVASDVALRMEEPRWYPLRLEVRSTAHKLKLSLGWASRSQRPEPVPADCLYAWADDRADASLTRTQGFDVGSAVVGEVGPQAPGDFGQGHFRDTAHLFTVLVPPTCECGTQRHQRLRDAIDAEKPAHTDYHLCFLKPRLRVGFQARLGIDAIVGNGPPPGRLNETVLGRSSYLAEAPAVPLAADEIRMENNA